MEFLSTRKVMTLGTDSASMGPLPSLAEPTHYAGLKYGMIWTEGATNLGALPETGAFYCMFGPKHKDGPYGEGRAFAIAGGELPRRLIDSAKSKRSVDLTLTQSGYLRSTLNRDQAEFQGDLEVIAHAGVIQAIPEGLDLAF